MLFECNFAVSLRYYSSPKHDVVVVSWGKREIRFFCFSFFLFFSFLFFSFLLNPPTKSEQQGLAFVQLQAVFCALTVSLRSFVDTTDFCSALSLDHAVQQDVSEFYKLVISFAEVCFWLGG